MKYQYNFSFLAQWMKANKNIPKGAIQQAIGAKSNNRLKSWEHGEGPMPVITMLRFCNAFQIPVSAFFRDSDADGKEIMRKPNGDEQLEPDGGFASDASDRARGERSLLNPLDVEIIPSIVPGWSDKQAQSAEQNTEQTTVSMQTTAQNVNTVVGNISNDNLSAFIEMEAKHRTQQDKLLDIIAEQQKQIADLTRILFERKQMRTYSVINDDCGLVAEPEPNKE
jgi:hypothetical protein